MTTIRPGMINALERHLETGGLPDGHHYDELWGAGLLWSVHWWESDHPKRDRERVEAGGRGHCWAVSDRGWRYMDFYRLGA